MGEEPHSEARYDDGQLAPADNLEDEHVFAADLIRWLHLWRIEQSETHLINTTEFIYRIRHKKSLFVIVATTTAATA